MAAKINNKHSPKELFVHIDRGVEGLRLVGLLRLEDQPFGASFQYADSWLTSPISFAIDPINMPMRTGEFATNNKYLVLGALFDAAPDLWGRKLLVAQFGLDSTSDEGSILLLGRGYGVGALLFSSESELARSQLPSLLSLPRIDTDLPRAHQAVFDFMNGTYSSIRDVEFEDGQMLAGSSGIGGARAKAAMRDDKNNLWIAKFKEPNEPFDRQRMEYANLKMAQAIGLEIPEIVLRDTHLGSVLLLRRFDRTASNERLHYVSAISLISHVYEEKKAPTAIDKAKFSYASIAEVIGKVCVDAKGDRHRIFAQMILNYLVKNTDDHLKNFGFVEVEGVDSTTKRMRLSPCFDIVTQPSPTHHLFTSWDGVKGDVQNAIENARSFGLTKIGAQNIADRVRSVVARRNEFYADAGLDGRAVEEINSMIGQL